MTAGPGPGTHSRVLQMLSMFSFNEVMNEFRRTTPQAYNSKQRGLDQSAGSPGFQVEFKQTHRRPISARGPAPNSQLQPVMSLNEPKHSGRPMRESPTALSSANGRGPVKRETVRPLGRPQDSNRTSVREPSASGAERGPISGGGTRPRNVGTPRPRPALLFVVAAGRAAGSEPQHSPGGGGRAPDPRGRRCGGLAARHVGEHGRAAAPGYDQPVRAGRGLRGRPGEAAAAGGALAVRDRPEHVFPGNQHSQQSPPPPDDVYAKQHTCHAAQLP
ncbi:PREDICTED: UBA-like domain-containing protein 2 isoform X2 [Chinchilla lanigera]|uniref:UBA-like domain-containing protein 2 isoform X2 n=1 Tax=Chinchilla lanigera TaxID=34839 RepID=UPI00038F14AE|nr:PREDICTED: UBA-like domain-containing protein 2 isoform X2 [Chinchilla lanigera]